MTELERGQIDVLKEAGPIVARQHGNLSGFVADCLAVALLAERQERENAAMRSLLQSLEWRVNPSDCNEAWCPVCDNTKAEGHTAECLFRVLQSTPAPPQEPAICDSSTCFGQCGKPDARDEEIETLRGECDQHHEFIQQLYKILDMDSDGRPLESVEEAMHQYEVVKACDDEIRRLREILGRCACAMRSSYEPVSWRDAMKAAEAALRGEVGG